MHLSHIGVTNFRLLSDSKISLETLSTVIVGRNNSGKTSLTEVLRRILKDRNPQFRLEDFSFSAHANFWDAFINTKEAELEDDAIRAKHPSIEVRLTLSYEAGEQLGLASEIVIDLDENCNDAVILVRFALKPGAAKDFFAELDDVSDAGKGAFFQTLKERISTHYATEIMAVDPNDDSNTKSIDASILQGIIASGFISAQRGLDDMTHKDRVVIGKILENLFATAKLSTSDTKDHATAGELETAVEAIQLKISQEFNAKLDALLPTLKIFGYPGLADPNLLTETTLDVDKLLSNHTRVLYGGFNGVNLPEAYNGLGARSIILILLQMRGFFKEYVAAEPRPAVQIVFVEEPEAHLHPQMQEVFIRKLTEISKAFALELEVSWPVQFIVSTHSSHLANEAHFESIRYFMCGVDKTSRAPKTIIKDLRKGLSNKPKHDRDFLHQYLTLTRCDLFFADKAILIEGTSERLLLPRIIRILDKSQPADKKLGSQYLSVIEVGGAYAHLFFDLLEFLEVQTLIVTDIDTAKPEGKNNRNKRCEVSLGTTTSNACIKHWYPHGKYKGIELVLEGDAGKVVSKRRLAFQVPEEAGGPCGRSFEDAFILANRKLFTLTETATGALETEAMALADEQKKSEFALKHAVMTEEWTIPRYIKEGLIWLADVPATAAPVTAAGVVE